MGERPPSTLAGPACGASNGRVRFGTFEVDLRARELRKSGLKIKLHHQPFQVLALLLERPGEVIRREEIQEKLWGSETVVDFEQGLNKAMNRLRDALGDSAENPRFIETFPRCGYRFIAATVPEVNQGEKKQSFPRRSGFALVGAAVFLIAAVLFAVDAGGVRRKLFSRQSASSQIHSLAVLPLTNMSGDPEQEYFADGMTEELITELSQVSSLKVISRTSVMCYKGSSKPLPQIGRELGVDGVVEGSVVRSGTRVRVNVQLIHAPSDLHLWAKSYEKNVQEVLTLQRDVAQAIAAEIQANLTPKQRTRLTTTRTINPEAYELYLKGRYHWSKRTEDSLKKSLDYFQRAIDLDPTYAVAYSGLADTYIVLGNNSFLPGKETYPKAKAAALKSLELDGSSAEAHASLGQVMFEFDRDLEGALKELQIATNLNPNYAMAHYGYGFRLAEMGRNEEGVREIEEARRLDPLSVRITANIALILYWGRHYDQAIIQARKALELEPNDCGTHVRLGDIYLQKGMTKEALAEFQSALCAENLTATPSSIADPYLARAYAASGNRAEAVRQLDKLQQPGGEYVSPFLIARLHVALGQNEEALAWLRKGLDEYAGGMDRINVEPDLDPLRPDPRFQDLLRRMNFPQ